MTEAEAAAMDMKAESADAGLALLPKKKKKKKKERRFQDDDDLGPSPSGENTADVSEQKAGKYPWSGTDRDYSYDELLDRAYSILREKNPELTGVIKKISLKPPNVSREGTKKTVLMNFADLCKSFNRQVDQVMPFITADMGTTGSLDGQNRLIMKGRFQSHNFATVLRRYINEYVLCASCKSFDTLLDRDSATRLMYLRCQQGTGHSDCERLDDVTHFIVQAGGVFSFQR